MALNARKAIALQFDRRQQQVEQPDFIGAAARGFQLGSQIKDSLSRDRGLEREERLADLEGKRTANRAKDLENKGLEIAQGIGDSVGKLRTIMATTTEGSPERQAAFEDPELVGAIGRIDPGLQTDAQIKDQVQAITAKLDPIEATKADLRLIEDDTRKSENEKDRDLKEAISKQQIGVAIEKNRLKKEELKHNKSKLTTQDAKRKDEAFGKWERSIAQVAKLENLSDRLAQVSDDKFSGGFSGGLQNYLKQAFNIGDDKVQQFTQEFADISVTNATESLRGLGPMTEKELELALSTQPQATDDPAVIQDWIDAKVKAARLESEYGKFQSDYIAKNRTSDGLIDAWQNHKTDQAAIDQQIIETERQSQGVEIAPGISVTAQENAEISAMAQQLGISMDELIRELQAEGAF